MATSITAGRPMENGLPSLLPKAAGASSEVALMKADGSGERMNLTESGFFDGGAKWAFGGKALLWMTDRDGKKPLAFQGASEVDVYAMFFDQEAYDKFKLTKDEFAY